MSGKLIMKRKFNKTQKPPAKMMQTDESSSSCNKHNKTEQTVLQTEIKRPRCNTPPPERGNSDLMTGNQVNWQNRHLLEAIQLKMVELQNELDDFENDVEAHEDYYLSEHNLQNNEMSERDAEALGFAMCAEETMLFLQREGIPSNSLLYTRLLNTFTGRPHSDRIFHI